MNKIFASLRGVLAWACLGIMIQAIPAQGAAEAPSRVAVLGEESLQDLVNLLSAELSKTPGVETVERGVLDQLTREASVQQVATGQRPVALARLAGARVLLFLEKKQLEAGKAAVSLRVVTVPDGLIRDTVWMPWAPEGVETTVRLTAARLEATLRTLASQGPAQVPQKRVSLLGIRATLSLPGMLNAESALNALLAHRLAALPGVVVTERWRMDDLVFEKAVEPGEESGVFPAGDRLVEGAMEAVGDRVTVRLKLRLSEADPGAITSFEGDLSNLRGLAAKLAAHIAELPRELDASWQPVQEAATQRELGAWLLQHGLVAPAAQACESGVALGDRSPESLVGRVKAWSMCGYPDDLRSTHGQDGGYQFKKLDPARLEFHLGAALRAVHYAADWIDDSPQTPAPAKWTLQDPPTLGLHVFYAALRTLRTAHESGRHLTLKMQVVGLRLALQRLVESLDRGRMNLNGTYNRYKANYAAYWCVSPEATLAYYRKIFAPDFGKSLRGQFYDDWDRVMRREFTYYDRRHGPFLDEPGSGDKPVEPGHSSLGTQRLIDWEGGRELQIKELWAQFLQQWQASPSPRHQADGLGMEMRAHLSLDSRIKDLDRMIALCWKHRDVLASREGEVMLAALHQELAPLGSSWQRLGPACHGLLGLFQDLFEKESWIPRDWIRELGTFESYPAKRTLDAARMQSLLAAMDAYSQRTQQDSRWKIKDRWLNQTMEGTFADTRRSLLHVWPPSAVPPRSAPSPAESLAVRRFWTPAQRVPGFEASKHIVDGQRLTLDAGRLWVGTSSVGLLSVDVKTLETRQWGAPPVPPKGKFWWRKVSVGDKWLYATDDASVWRRPLDGDAWTQLSLPGARYGLHPLQGSTALSFGRKEASLPAEQQGVGAALLEGGDARWLVSSRRRPTVHPLDGAAIHEIKSVFTGTRGERWMAWEDDRHTIVQSLDHPGETPLRFPHLLRVVPSENQTLLWEEVWYAGRCPQVTQAWRLRHDQDRPELLLFDPKESKLSEDTPSVWKLPAEYRSHLPSAPLTYQPVVHRDQLWILKIRKEDFRSLKGDYSLVGFLPGRETPVTIPLRFELSDSDRTLLNRKAEVSDLENPDCRDDGFVADDKGLVFSGNNLKGVWLLSWEEIEKFIASKSLR